MDANQPMNARKQRPPIADPEPGKQASIRVGIVRARAKSGVEQEYGVALMLGRLTVCCNCSRFTFNAEPSELGTCSEQGPVAPFAPDRCPQFNLSADPAAPKIIPHRIET